MALGMLVNRSTKRFRAFWVIGAVLLCMRPGLVRGQELPVEIFDSVPGTVNPAITSMQAAFASSAGNVFVYCLNQRANVSSCQVGSGGGPGGGGTGGGVGGGTGVRSNCGSGVCYQSSGGAFQRVGPTVTAPSTNSPADFSEYFTFNQSAVENQTWTYLHWATDVPRPEGSGVAIRRMHRSRDWSTGGSFGPGVFSNFDIRLTVDVNELDINSCYGHAAELFDPFSTAPLTYVPVPSTGVTLPQYRTRSKELLYYDDQMQLLSTVSVPYSSPLDVPAFAKVNLWDGGYFLFELINVEVPPSDSSYGVPTHGRLVEAKTNDGAGFTVNYKTWTNTQLEVSPTRLWQIDTVVDSSGPTFTFDYDSDCTLGKDL